MPSAEEFKTNFAGHAVPAELEKLRAFEERADGQYFSESFELTVDDKSGLKTWSDDATFLAALMPFAQANGSGSFYALWANGAPPSEMPVVVFGDEGGAYVVAENVRGLLSLLSYDAEPTVDDEGVTFFKDEDDEDREDSDAHETYVEWLHKSFRLSAIDEAESIVETAQEKHGAAFKIWLKQYAES